MGINLQSYRLNDRIAGNKFGCKNFIFHPKAVGYGDSYFKTGDMFDLELPVHFGLRKAKR